MMKLFVAILLAAATPAAATMRFASPLQTLTIWDDSQGAPSPRELYLEKFQAGLDAEHKVRQELQKQHEDFLSKQDTESPAWAARAERYERTRLARQERAAEKAYDGAVQRVDARQKQRLLSGRGGRNKKSNFQFVGVINKKSETPITWYARKKPASADWSLRLVHVNKDNIIKDLFNRGKVDIFSKYKNMGFIKTATKEGEEENAGPKDLQIEGNYEVRERSWRTMWNFSPKHMFTDSSGQYWRERRLRPGVYTDGASVFETTYRYKDGRNGIRRVTSLGSFMKDASVDASTKESIRQRIKKQHPDLVLEG